MILLDGRPSRFAVFFELFFPGFFFRPSFGAGVTRNPRVISDDEDKRRVKARAVESIIDSFCTSPSMEYRFGGSLSFCLPFVTTQCRSFCSCGHGICSVVPYFIINQTTGTCTIVGYFSHLRLRLLLLRDHTERRNGRQADDSLWTTPSTGTTAKGVTAGTWRIGSISCTVIIQPTTRTTDTLLRRLLFLWRWQQKTAARYNA